MALEFTLTDHTDEVLDALDEQIEAALEAVGIQCEGYAQDIVEAGVPRHGGSWYTSQGAAGLKGSITHQVKMDEKAVYVGTNNEHAIYNEFGTGIYADGGGRQSPWAYQDDEGNWHRTRGMTPLHFLKKAAADHITEFKAIIQSILRGGS